VAQAERGEEFLAVHTSAAKASSEKQVLIAAVNRCATQKQLPNIFAKPFSCNPEAPLVHVTACVSAGPFANSVWGEHLKSQLIHSRIWLEREYTLRVARACKRAVSVASLILMATSGRKFRRGGNV